MEELTKRGFVGRQRLITVFAEKQPAMKQVEKDESKCQEVCTIPEERMEKKTMKLEAHEKMRHQKNKEKKPRKIEIINGEKIQPGRKLREKKQHSPWTPNKRM